MYVFLDKKQRKFLSILSGIILLLFLVFIIIHESRTRNATDNDTQHYGELISGYLWNIDKETAQEYITLITIEGNFKSISVTHNDGSPFTAYQHENYQGESYSLLSTLGLIRDIHSSSPIYYKNNHIGTIKTVRENTNIYTYVYISLTLVLGIVLIALIRTGKADKIQRKHLELDLIENKERLHSIVSASPLITFTLDKHGVFKFCEGLGLKKLSENPVNLIGKSLEDVQHEIPATMHDFLKALQGKSFSAVRDTDDRSFETWYFPIHEGNLITGVTGVSTDVTAALQAMKSLDAYKSKSKREHALAQNAQSAFRPTETPPLNGYEIGFLCKPTQSIGGDYLHFTPSADNNTLGITFAEMSGHGVSAALLASIFHTQVQQHLNHHTKHFDQSFFTINKNIHSLFPEGRFASTFFTYIDATSDTVRYVKASKEPAILYKKEQSPHLLDKGGAVLGLLPSDLLHQTSYEEETIQLEGEDTLLLYSDGVVTLENAAGNPVERKSLIQWVEEEIHLPPQELVNSIYRKVISHSAGQELTDDISLLIIRKQKK